MSLARTALGDVEASKLGVTNDDSRSPVASSPYTPDYLFNDIALRRRVASARRLLDA